jgi:hypothetical protein
MKRTRPMDNEREFVMSRMTAVRTGGRALGILAAAAILVACGELPQDGPMPFVQDGTYGGAEAPADARTRGQALAERASLQNEYLLLEEKSTVALTASAQ